MEGSSMQLPKKRLKHSHLHSVNSVKYLIYLNSAPKISNQFVSVNRLSSSENWGSRTNCISTQAAPAQLHYWNLLSILETYLGISGSQRTQQILPICLLSIIRETMETIKWC